MKCLLLFNRYGVNLGDPNVFRSYGDETPQQLGASVQRALLRLKIACEDIKCALSDMQATVKKIGKHLSIKRLTDLWPPTRSAVP